MDNLQRLQRLCDVVNNRYQNGLNDDDQVRTMLQFSRGINDVNLLIGYEDYQAMSTEEVAKYIAEGAEEYTPGYFKIFVNGRHYNTKKPN